MTIGTDELFVLQVVSNIEQEVKSVIKLMRRTNMVHIMRFKLDTYSEVQAIQDFRFKVPEVQEISEIFGCIGVTSRNLYACE